MRENVSFIILVIISAYTFFYFQNQPAKTSHSKLINQEKEKLDPILQNPDKFHYEPITAYHNKSKIASYKTSSPPTSPYDSEVVVAFRDILIGQEVISESFSDDGDISIREILMDVGSIATIYAGIPGGSDRGYNFRPDEHAYSEYDNDVLAELADKNDREAQMLLGSRLIRNDEMFSVGEKYLHQAAKNGYTGAYHFLSTLYSLREDFISAHAYNIVLKSIKDPIGIRFITNFEDKLTEEELREAKKFAEDIEKIQNNLKN